MGPKDILVFNNSSSRTSSASINDIANIHTTLRSTLVNINQRYRERRHSSGTRSTSIYSIANIANMTATTSKYGNRKADPEPNPRDPGTGRRNNVTGRSSRLADLDPQPRDPGTGRRNNMTRRGSRLADSDPQPRDPGNGKVIQTQKFVSLYHIDSRRAIVRDGKIKSALTVTRAGDEDDEDDEDEPNPRDSGNRAF
jgi:hypothetical protein